MTRTCSLMMVALALPACGDDGGGARPDAPKQSPDSRPIDAPPDSPDGPPPSIDIQLGTYARTAISLHYRVGGGAWQPVAVASGFGHATIAVTGPYEVAFVCGTPAHHGTFLYRFAFEDDPDPFITCYAPGGGGGGGGGGGDPLAVISGDMVQPGTVSMSDTATSDAPNWHFELAGVGTDDLYAFDGARIVLRRGLDTSADATIPTIDLATEGTPLTLNAYALHTIDADEEVSGDTFYQSDYDGATISDVYGTTTLAVMPAALVEPQDFELADLYLDSPTGQRFAEFDPLHGAATSVDLMPRLHGVTLGVTSASWTAALPAGNIAFQNDDPANQLSVSATAGARGASTALEADVSTLPGFDPSWLPASSGYQYFQVSATDAQGTYVSSLVYGTTALAPGHHIRPRSPRRAKMLAAQQALRQARSASRKILP